MNTNEIEQFIPHRKPMLLVDEIVSRTEDKIVCRKTFHEDDFFVQGHFPGQPIVPGVIQCECCLQAGAILLSADTMQDAKTREVEPRSDSKQPDTDSPSGDGRVPVATRMDAVKFKRMVRPGDTVEIQVVLNEQISNAYYLTGKMLLDGKLAARLDFACSIANPGPPTAEKST
jgi:3-hydroxyacyl-[acyl-carrier-protein] dehydratase